MVILIKKEQKTLEYQETMNLDVENIANNKNMSVFASTKHFPTEFLDRYKNYSNNIQNIPSELKLA